MLYCSSPTLVQTCHSHTLQQQSSMEGFPYAKEQKNSRRRADEQAHLVPSKKEASDARVAFSYKSTLIEQCCDCSKGAEIDVHLAPAKFDKTLDSFLEQLMVPCTGCSTLGRRAEGGHGRGEGGGGGEGGRVGRRFCKGPPMGKSQSWKSRAFGYSAPLVFHEQGNNLLFVLMLALGGGGGEDGEREGSRRWRD